MSINCHLFAQDINGSSQAIWLDEDAVPVGIIPSGYVPVFIVGFTVTIIIAVIISCSASCFHYRGGVKQKQIVLNNAYHRFQNVPYLKRDIIPYLNKHTSSNRDINQIIIKYANIELTKKFPFVLTPKVLHTKSGSETPMTSTSLFMQVFMIAGFFLIAIYYSISAVLIHNDHTYRSYLETQCYFHWIDIDEYHYKTEVIIAPLCTDDTKHYIEKHEFYVDGWGFTHGGWENGANCYVHRENVTVRQPGEGCCSCTEIGKCCVYTGSKETAEADNNCYNGCGYFAFIVCAFVSCFGGLISMEFTDLEFENRTEYAIKRRSSEYTYTRIPQHESSILI